MGDMGLMPEEVGREHTGSDGTLEESDLSAENGCYLSQSVDVGLLFGSIFVYRFDNGPRFGLCEDVVCCVSMHYVQCSCQL